jgi:hypothetical protein
MLIVLLVFVGLLIGAALLLIAVIVERTACIKWPSVQGSLLFRMSLGFGMVVALPMVITLPNWLENPRLLMYFVPTAFAGILPFVPWWINAKTRSRHNRGIGDP